MSAWPTSSAGGTPIPTRPRRRPARRGSAVSGRGSARPRGPPAAGVAGLARGTRRASRVTVASAKRASEAQGAGESGLSRLIQMHVFNTAGDAAVAISLAGSLFFQVPSGEARGQVALFLGPHDAAVRDRGAADRAVPRPLRPRPALGDRRDDGHPGVPLLGARLGRWPSGSALVFARRARRAGVVQGVRRHAGRRRTPAPPPRLHPGQGQRPGLAWPASSAPRSRRPSPRWPRWPARTGRCATRSCCSSSPRSARSGCPRPSTPARARASWPGAARTAAPSRARAPADPDPGAGGVRAAGQPAGRWFLAGFLLMFVAFLLRDPDVRPGRGLEPRA